MDRWEKGSAGGREVSPNTDFTMEMVPIFPDGTDCFCSVLPKLVYGWYFP